jgi:hypothetical protein
MHGQTNATNATFEQLARAEWFSAVGNSVSGNVSTLSSWAEAIEQCASLEWENLCLDAANQLRSRIAEVAPERLQQWNPIVERMKAVSVPLVREKVAKVVAEHALPKVFEDTVQWDVLHLLMEAEYSDIVAPSFYAAQAFWYVKGRFPCGWAGKFPTGRLVIF